MKTPHRKIYFLIFKIPIINFIAINSSFNSIKQYIIGFKPFIIFKIPLFFNRLHKTIFWC